MRIIMLLLYSLVWMLGCSSGNDDGLLSDGQTDGQIKFEISFAGGNKNLLRGATASDFTSTWEIGDEIGVFAVKHGGSLAASNNNIHNVKLTHQNDGTWSGAVFWPNTCETYDFYAYYPYDDSMSDPTAYTFSVQTNQSTVANYSKSDLLMAKNDNGGSGFTKNAATVVSLQFSHAMSLIQVEFESGGAIGANLNGMEKVYLRAIGTTTSFDLSIGTVMVDASETVTDIEMIKVDGLTNTYRALISAQSIPSNTALFVISRGGCLTYTTNAAVMLTQANAAKYKILLQAPTLDPTHTYAVGDPYPYLGLAEGIVWKVSNSGFNGKIVSLDEKSMAKWGIYDGQKGLNSTDNGMVNMNTLSNYINNNSGNWENYPPFAWVHEKNGGGVTNYYTDPNAKGIWYLQSITELQHLYCVYNGKDAETWHWPWSDNPNEEYPTFKNDNATSARNDFNQKLTSAGGIALSSDWYSSSSEYGNFHVYDMTFADGQAGNSTKQQPNIARAMMAF